MPPLYGPRAELLHAESAVDLDLPLIIDPGHPENDLTLRLAYSFDKRIIHIIWMLRDHAAQAFQHLADCLMKLRLPGITPQDFFKNWLHFFVNAHQIYTPSSEFMLTRTEVLGGG